LSRWRERLDKNPADAAAEFALGVCYLNANLKDRAVAHLRRAASLAPEMADVHYNLAVALYDDGYTLINSPDYQQAVAEIDLALRVASDFAEARALSHFIRGRKFQDVDTHAAISEYEMGVQACSDIAILHNNLGICLLKVGRLEDAVTTLRHSVGLGENAQRCSNLCLGLFKTGRYSEGIQYGLRAVALLRPGTRPNSQADCYNSLALCLWKDGQKEQAIINAKKAVSLSPTIKIYRENLAVISGHLLKMPVNRRVLVATLIAILLFVLALVVFTSVQ